MNSSELLDTDLLRTFLTVARHGNVTRGARVLHRTQSAVSTQIKRLEASLGATLFTRGPRGVTLTEPGQRLRAAAERIVNDLDNTVTSFRTDPIGGVVRVGIPDEYGSDILPTILAEFATHYPGVEVFVQCGFSAEFPEAVSRGELDLAVYAAPVGLEGTQSLCSDPMVWVAASQYRVEPDTPVQIAVFDRNCWWRDVTLSALADAGRPYRVMFSSESSEGIKAAVATGLAVGVLSRASVSRSMQLLGERQGFPRLPDSALYLRRSEVRSVAIDAMACAIEEGFSGLR